MSIYRYRQYRAALKLTPFTGQVMPYDWRGLPDALPMDWMPYDAMCREFSRELANVVNDLTHCVHQLAAWRSVLEKLREVEKMKVAREFVDPIATVALHLPYVIKSRFFFAAAHLNHQANRAKLPGQWQDDLAPDTDIYLEHADEAGKGWKAWRKLKARLERVNDRSFQARSGDFRNAYHHRFSPHIVVGLSQVVTRQVDTAAKKVRYGIGARGPITMPAVCELLEGQRRCCYEAFEAFQRLVREHEVAILASVLRIGNQPELN